MGPRFAEVEPTIMVTSLEPSVAKRALRRPMRNDAPSCKERIVLLMAEQERREIAKNLCHTIEELNPSLEDFTLQDVPIVDGASFLLSPHGRVMVASHLARGLCGAAGETILRRDPYVQEYLAQEAHDHLVLPANLVLCECERVARYVEECLLAKHGADLVRVLTP